MNKWSRMAATSAVALALAAPAYAQTTTPTPSATPPSPSDSSSSTGSTMGGTTQESTTATPSTPTASAGEVMTEQESGQTLSSDLIGMKVVGANQESIGKVSELIIENDQVIGAVLDVGGFLGLGAKKVGVPWSDLSVSDADGSMVANVTLSKEALTDMPEYKTLAEAQAEQSRQPATGTTGTTGGIGGGTSTN